jgi:hypothetical protein
LLCAYAGVISMAPPERQGRAGLTVKARFCAGNRRGL